MLATAPLCHPERKSAGKLTPVKLQIKSETKCASRKWTPDDKFAFACRCDVTCNCCSHRCVIYQTDDLLVSDKNDEPTFNQFLLYYKIWYKIRSNSFNILKGLSLWISYFSRMKTKQCPKLEKQLAKKILIGFEAIFTIILISKWNAVVLKFNSGPFQGQWSTSKGFYSFIFVWAVEKEQNCTCKTRVDEKHVCWWKFVSLLKLSILSVVERRNDTSGGFDRMMLGSGT